MKQLAMKLPVWGGRRRGAGRKPKGEKAGVVHLTRPRLKKMAIHVTWRIQGWNLRSQRCFKVIEAAFWAACDRFGMRITHFSVQGNHIHMVVEAHDHECLSRAMQGLGVRIAKKLNQVMGRHGKVLADRYHGHVLRTPTEIRNAVHYVLHNHQRHHGKNLDSAQIYIDPYASNGKPAGQTPVVPPMTWLMRKTLGLPAG